MAPVLGEVDPGLAGRHCLTGVTVPGLLVLVGVVAPDGGVVVVLVLFIRSLGAEETLTMHSSASSLHNSLVASFSSLFGIYLQWAPWNKEIEHLIDNILKR